jgi:predicted ATPase
MVGAAGLAGRVDELREVTQLLRDDSQHAAMLLIGEAGVGKTRLVTAAAGFVASDVLVLSGWCLPMSNSVSFLPLADLLRELEEIDRGRLLTVALDNCQPFVRDEVLRLMPGAHDHSVDRTTSDGSSRQRLFDAMRRLFVSLSNVHRAAIVIEDVHWADTSTLELLDYLFAPGHAAGVPVLLTCRAEETSSRTLIDWLDRLQRNPRIRRRDLTPLTEEETSEQIELLLGQRPPPRFVAETYRRSEGNAFFTEQLVAARDDDELPAGLMSLLLSRTKHVSGDARDILATLGIAARPLDEAALVRLCRRPESQVREALRDLLARRLLRRPDRAGRHQLRHALLADAITAELLPSERARLHGELADLMTEWNESSVAAEIATHLAAADRPVDELRWRVIAARHADTVYASTEAAEHWQRAVALTVDDPVDQTTEGMSLAELYAAAEDALFRSGGSEDAVYSLTEAALQRLIEVDPASRADVLRRAGEMRGHSAPQQGLDLLSQAVALYERLPLNEGHIYALREISHILMNNGRQTEAAEVINRAAALLEHANFRETHLEISAHQAWKAIAAGDGEIALERIHAVRESLTEWDEPIVHAWMAVVHTDILLSLGRLSEVEATAAPALQAATLYGAEKSLGGAVLRWNVADALTELGSVDAAARLIDPATQGTVDPVTRLDYGARAKVEMLQGNLDGAQRRWVQMRALPPTWLVWQAKTCLPEAELHLWRGAPLTAYRQVNALLADAIQINEGGLSGQLLALTGPLLVPMPFS